MNSLIDDMNYLTCTKNHHQEELSMVCLEESCIGNLLICPICWHQHHQGHKVIPLKQYLKDNSKDQKNINKSVLEHMTQIQHNKQALKKQILSIKQIFLDEMYNLENKSVEYFNQIAEKFLELSSIKNGNEIRKILRCFQQGSIVKCKRILQNIRKHSKVSSKQILNHYVKMTEDNVKAARQVFQKISIEKNIDSLMAKLGVIPEFSIKPIYKWSQYKSQKININGMIATQTSGNTGGQRFALTQPKSNQKSKKIEVGFKICVLKGWIGVGICLQNAIKTANYHFNYTQTYHGSYLISSNAYSWSHSQPNLNSHQNAFPFTAGDVIKVTLNLQLKELVFENLTKGGKFKLEVIDPPHNDRYVPCVNLCTAGDEIELLNDI